MKRPAGVSRRTSLQLLLASAGTSLMGQAAAYGGVASQQDLDLFLHAAVARVAPHARAIGHDRLRAARIEEDYWRLWHRIKSRLLRAQETQDRKKRDLQLALSEAVRADFASGDVVLVDSWIISRTEATLCLLSILQPAETAADHWSGSSLL